MNRVDDACDFGPDPIQAPVTLAPAALPDCDYPDHGLGCVCAKVRRGAEHNKVYLGIDPGLERMFWARVEKRGSDECWPWLGTINDSGYGVLNTDLFDDKKHPVRAHRISYRIHHGVLVDGMCALHTCDNPPCVNPKHLFAGTRADNIADMISKGRDYRGEVRRGSAIGTAKLTEADVLEAHRLESEGVSQRTIAGLLEVSQAQIQRVLSGQSWGHLRPASAPVESVYLGVDPGLDGFLAFLDRAGKLIAAEHVPLLPNDGGYDRVGMFELLVKWKPRIILAVIEEQQAFPGSGPPCPACKRPKGQGAVATFTTGMGYGLWLMALAAAGIPTEKPVRPASWKKAMGIMPATGLDKNARTKEAKRLAVERATGLHPGVDLRENERCRVPHAGKCEAMILAEYGRRVHGGDR